MIIFEILVLFFNIKNLYKYLKIHILRKEIYLFLLLLIIRKLEFINNNYYKLYKY